MKSQLIKIEYRDGNEVCLFDSDFKDGGWSWRDRLIFLIDATNQAEGTKIMINESLYVSLDNVLAMSLKKTKARKVPWYKQFFKFDT